MSLRQEKDPFWCNWNSQQHRFWKLLCCNRDDGIGHLARRTLPQSSVSWYSNLRPELDRLGFTKFQFQLLLSKFAFGSHALNKSSLFYVRWHHTLKSVMLIQGGRGGPSPKVRVFCNSGWPDSGKFCGSIACPYSTGHCRYSQETEEQCSDLDYNQSHAPS